MRFPIPLVIAIVFLTAVVVIINVNIKVVTSFDPEYVTFNGTHYIYNAAAAPPPGAILPYGTIQDVSGVTSITQILGWGTAGGSCNQFTYFVPTVKGWDNVPIGSVVSFSVPAGAAYFYRHDVNTLSIYCVIQTATGAKYHYNILYKNHTKIGDFTIFRMAKKGEVTTSQMCDEPSGLPHIIVYAVLRGERYDCTTASYTTYGTPNTQTITPQVGTKLGTYYVVSWPSYTFVLHGLMYPGQAGQMVISPE